VTTDPLGHRHSYLVGFPIGGVWSTVKDVLDPKRGLSVSLTVAPNVGDSNGPVFFTLAELTSNYHWPIDKSDKYIGAVWMHMGAFAGPGTAVIPPDKRYYAGGAGSVRGYGFRLLGPTDANGKPIGGRSVFEGGAELRFPILNRIGGAVFVEAGGVDETGIFEFKDGIGESIGLGLRYATGIGPIRVDAALPLDRRKGIDRPFQIYVGLGQAF
jgi:translocation and assembly module TamA